MKIGIDIVEIKRIKLSEEFINKVLHQSEIKILNDLKTTKLKQQFLAGRFSVKEAIFKATQATINMNEIAIYYNENNEPKILNDDFNNIIISISHEKNYAVSCALNTKE